jgi:simple sugar transport system ATP-binding protein
MSTSSLVELAGIELSFGRSHVLRNLSCKVPQARITGLVGDNGAGKSTLIKLITGLYRPDQGEYLFDGKLVHLRSPGDAQKLGIETVFQDLALVDEMSVSRNFFLGREPTRKVGPFRLLDRKRMEEESAAALKKIGVRVRASGDNVAELSGGERQALAIGRSLHFGSRLLILDEPTSALSLKETNRTLDTMRAAREKGLTILFITHNLYDMLAVCDHFIVLNLGKVVAELSRSEASLEKLSHLIRGEEDAHHEEHAVTV